MNYLEAVQAAGTDDADTIVKALEGKKINDMFLRNGEVRAEDHRVVHDAYLAKVKTKDQVKEPWDYEEIVKTIPAAEAFRSAGRLLQALLTDGLLRPVHRPRPGGGQLLRAAALGLAVIFGVLGVVNFAHGACYMLGAVGAARPARHHRPRLLAGAARSCRW